MKKLQTMIFLLMTIPMIGLGQDQKAESQYIEWTGEDEIANALVMRGAGHWLNAEWEKAFTFFDASVQQDPSLFAPHVALAMMSEGDSKAHHKAQAQKLVKGKNDASRLFVTLLDTKDGKEGAAEVAKIWADIYKVAYDGRLVHFAYARSRENPKDQIAELEKLAAKNAKDGHNNGYVHNILGYTYQGTGETEKARMHFEKYLELYPDGYNPYDSMGEFYLNTGDLNKALSYYQKAKEKYPSSVNATNQINKIEGMMSEEGNLVLVANEYVDPEFLQDYMAWGKEYKAVADETGFSSFWVSSSNEAFSYASVAGKTMEDLGNHHKALQDWHKAHPKLQELYKKYHHSVTHTDRELWRHSLKMSYQPKDYMEVANPTYVRVYKGFVKFGHEDAVKDILAEYKTLWESNGISYPYSVYWNVFGENGTCVAFRSEYKDVEAWSAEHKEVNEKIGEEKMMDIMSRWNQHMRYWKNEENFPMQDMTHIREVNVAEGN